jgi:hypothetical protein
MIAILCRYLDDHFSGLLTGFQESPASRLASARKNLDEVRACCFALQYD